MQEFFKSLLHVKYDWTGDGPLQENEPLPEEVDAIQLYSICNSGLLYFGILFVTQRSGFNRSIEYSIFAEHTTVGYWVSKAFMEHKPLAILTGSQT
jgi:hypothetical protein